MKMATALDISRVVSTGLAAAALAVGYGVGSAALASIVPVCLGLLWLAGQWREWRWSSSACFVSVVVVAAAGTWLDVAPIFVLTGIVAALAAWDLDRFAQRVGQARQVIHADQLVRRHLERLGLVCGLGLLLGGLGLGTRVHLGLGLALLLGIIALAGSSLAVSFVRSDHD